MPRSPRFKRISDPSPIQLTERDFQLIRHIYEHRFLRSSQLTKLSGGSVQSVLRRLQKLFHHGYLDRPRAQIEHYRSGSQPMVYGIGNKGVGLLETRFGLARRKVDWTTKNRAATRLFLEHTLAVAEILVALELACRENSTIALDRPDPTAGSTEWHVNVNYVRAVAQLGVVPDAIFALRNKASSDAAWFFLEADRATMPVRRHGLKQTSFFRKLLAYHETWRQKLLRERFPRFRVLTVTTTPDRVNHLIEAAQSLPQARGLFLFTDKNSFLSFGDPLQAQLLNGRGETVILGE